MKVVNFMQKSPIAVTEDRTIREAVRLIFNLGVSAVLVTRENKLVGIITETDILHHLFPSVRDFMEDYVRSRDFNAMEQNMADILSKPVTSIMTKKVTSVGPETPIMQAQSTMFLRKFSHMPVVDSEMKLVGMVSQGDIFRALASKEIPYDTNEEFLDWATDHYDMVESTTKRHAIEADSLVGLFKKNNTKRIVDVGCAIGKHAILLAVSGYEVLGLERSKPMYKDALDNYNHLEEREKNRVSFLYNDDYSIMLEARKREFDAAIFMGNEIGHMHSSYKKVLGSVEVSLRKKNALLILQIANFEKILTVTKRFQDFNIVQSKANEKREYAFLEFYDPPRKEGGPLTLSMAVLTFTGTRWTMTGIDSTPIAYITTDSIKPLLQSIGFQDISLFGSQYGEQLFERKFNKETDDWLNVVARR